MCKSPIRWSCSVAHSMPPPPNRRYVQITEFLLHFPAYIRRVQGFIQDFSTVGGGGPASVPLCSYPHYTRWVGGGGNYASTDLIVQDLIGQECQACVTIYGCKIAYVHIQLAFEISVSLKISWGDDPPPQILSGGVSTPPVSPLARERERDTEIQRKLTLLPCSVP